MIIMGMIVLFIMNLSLFGFLICLEKIVNNIEIAVLNLEINSKH